MRQTLSKNDKNINTFLEPKESDKIKKYLIHIRITIVKDPYFQESLQEGMIIIQIRVP